MKKEKMIEILVALTDELDRSLERCDGIFDKLKEDSYEREQMRILITELENAVNNIMCHEEMIRKETIT